MKYLLTIIVLGSSLQIVKAQLSFKIEKLSLSNYNVVFKDNDIDEDLGRGPYVYFNCAITNNSEDTITLRPANSTIEIVYYYQKRRYKIGVVPLPFVDIKVLTILPGETFYLDFGSSLLLGTDILNYKKGDYTKEMLVVLPTLTIHYKDNNIDLRTDEIKSVVLK